MTSPAGFIPYLPERIQGLAAIATNLWWSWHTAPRDMFRAIDSNLWQRSRHNPLELLQRVDPARLQGCANDPDFLRLYESVLASFRLEMETTDTWFARQPSTPAGHAVFAIGTGNRGSPSDRSGRS